MEQVYICYYGKTAHTLRNLPGIIFLKENRNVCFYDEEEKVFLDSDMNPLDISEKTIIPFCYIGVEKEFFDAIKNNGGIIPCDLENISDIEHWSKFYEPKRRTLIIKGKDLINEEVLDQIEKEYGKEIFFKTIRKAYSDKIKIEDLRNNRTVIYTALSLHPEDEFMISEYIHLLDDEIGTKEYRIFVYNNQILNISRHTEFILHRVDKDILTKALEVVEEMKKKNFPSAYVLDLGEYIDNDGKKEIDVIEFNPMIASGHYLYNSVDFLPCDDMLHTNLYNVAIEFRDLVSLCKMPDDKYKNILKPSKYYGDPGSFAYDLKYINDFDSVYNGNDHVTPGKLVDKYLKCYNEPNKRCVEQKDNLISEILRNAGKETDMHMKQLFLENIKRSVVLVDENYLCCDVFPSDFEKREVNLHTLTINQDMLKHYIESHPEEQGLKKLVKSKSWSK